MARAMGKTLCIITLVTLCAIIGADARRCYVCQGCDSVSEENIQTCEAPTTVAPGSTTAASTSAPGNDVTTNAPASEVTTNPPGGEVVTNPPGGEVVTNPPGGEVATNPPGGEAATNPPGGEVATNPPVGEVVTNPPGGEVATNPPGGEVVTNPPGGEAATNPPGGEAATNPPSGEAATNPPGDAAATNPPSGEAATNPPGDAAATNPPSGEAATNPPGGGAAPSVPGGGVLGGLNNALSYRGKRSVMQIRAEPEPQCLMAVVDVNGAENIVRDCYFPPAQEPEDAIERCRIAVGAAGNITSCTVCGEDLCNASARTTGTVALIIASLISAFRFYFA